MYQCIMSNVKDFCFAPWKLDEVISCLYFVLEVIHLMVELRAMVASIVESWPQAVNRVYNLIHELNSFQMFSANVTSF